MQESELKAEEGELLIKLARRAIETFLKSKKALDPPQDIPNKLKEKSGVFVTLNKKSEAKELRGCIGYPYPTDPLMVAVINSAIEAATGDPRFPPVTLNELNEIVIEVSVLTTPELIKVSDPLELPKKILIGKDGLIIERGLNKGLLLPQVPIDWNWNEEEYLANLCAKGGLPLDGWVMEGAKIYKFQAIIFGEEEPNGEVRFRALR